jgi:sulfatase maturation enzyme AslB (radical SAM superfamily)
VQLQSVAIGCDGPAEQHDAIRRDIHGNATYDQVAAAISALVDAGVTTFASTSITPHNVAELGNFSAFFESLGVSKFGFNFLRGKLLFRLIRRDRLQDYYERATDGVLANFDNSGGRHLEYQIERKHLAFLERHYFPTDCSAYGNQLVVEPAGQIGNCPFIRGTMGNVHDVSPDFRIRTQPVVQKWRARLPQQSGVRAVRRQEHLRSRMRLERSGTQRRSAGTRNIAALKGLLRQIAPILPLDGTCTCAQPLPPEYYKQSPRTNAGAR